jgi:hypothetical protein
MSKQDDRREIVSHTDFFSNCHNIKNVLAAFPVQATIDWFASSAPIANAKAPASSSGD